MKLVLSLFLSLGDSKPCNVQRAEDLEMMSGPYPLMDFAPHKCQEEDDTLYFTKYCTPWSCFCIDSVTAESRPDSYCGIAPPIPEPTEVPEIPENLKIEPMLDSTEEPEIVVITEKPEIIYEAERKSAELYIKCNFI